MGNELTCRISLKDPWHMMTLPGVHSVDVVRVWGVPSGAKGETFDAPADAMGSDFWKLKVTHVVLAGRNDWIDLTAGSLVPVEITIPVKNVSVVEWSGGILKS